MWSERVRDEAGSALAVTMMAMFVVSIAIMAMLTQAEALHEDTAYRSADDQLLVATESAIDRYVSKLVINANYANYWVDEFEPPRTCVSSDPLLNGTVVQPGNAWPAGCADWSYTATPETIEFVHHPLLGEAQISLIVEPKNGFGQPVTVVGRFGEDQYRAVSVVLSATSLGEFVRVTEGNLSYGSNAVLTGKVYSGGNLSWGSNNTINSDYYAEGSISGSVIETDGAEGYNGSGSGGYGHIRDVFSSPLNFDNFWDDMSEIQALACAGAGYCLNDQGSAAAYLVHPYMVAGSQRLDIYYSTAHSGSANGCSYSSSDWWEREMHNPSVTWQVWGLNLPTPSNGLIWSDQHIILGNRDSGLGTSGTAEIGDSMTIYTGTPVQPRSIIINSDVEYDDVSSNDQLGLIASNNIVINPDSHNGDGNLRLEAALLGQGTPGLRTAQRCGDSGGNIMNGAFVLNGALATQNSAWMSGSWSPRTYGYDERLASFQPPYYPLVDRDWVIIEWDEENIPDWAK